MKKDCNVKGPLKGGPGALGRDRSPSTPASDAPYYMQPNLPMLRLDVTVARFLSRQRKSWWSVSLTMTMPQGSPHAAPVTFSRPTSGQAAKHCGYVNDLLSTQWLVLSRMYVSVAAQLLYTVANSKGPMVDTCNQYF